MKKFSTMASVFALATAASISFPAATSADIQHLDDVIISFSLCIGNDCVNGESFGFDTLRLKENNLRINFQDTSNSASFPTNDWRIVINDSSNGGGNYFAIEDSNAGRIPFRVEAGAPVNSLYVESDGDVGIKTANPVVDLHIVEGNTPTLRLEQDGSNGFTPQTWDVAGNETNFFIRDATNGSPLPFRIQPSAPQNSIFIESTGDVGFGTASPSARIHATTSSTESVRLDGNGHKFIHMFSDDNNALQLRMNTDSDNRRIVALNSAGTIESQIHLSTSSVQFRGLDAAGNWATIDATGITTNGPTCNPGPCDRTFDSEYFEVASIEEHAAFMWENQYLWGVGPTNPDLPYNVTEKTAGILHELEVAHIYIEQLDARIRSLESRLTE